MPHDIPVKKILENNRITASAPCRIDAGGTWDIKAMSLSFERHQPATFNIALNLRTTVALKPFREGMVGTTSEGFPDSVTCNVRNMDLSGPFAIFFAAVNYFGFSGLEIKISSESPVRSALGGSSTALVALIKALAKLDEMSGSNGRFTKKDILYLGYHLEDGISGGNCGMQDQAAAVFGGVNGWSWKYSNRDMPVKREKLLDDDGMKQLSKRILVAYSGKWHVSASTNRVWLKNFLEGKTRSGWLEANTVVRELIKSVKSMEWRKSVECIKEEMKLRRRITPDALIPETSGLIKEAEKTGCGARFAGAGAGGSVWALGELEDINRLRERWNKSLSKLKDGYLLQCAVDPKGVL
jgi:D-glycero-alpha-D-manno-heptose-7-phosphate kinase